jgi:hypothetical protein
VAPTQRAPFAFAAHARAHQQKRGTAFGAPQTEVALQARAPPPLKAGFRSETARPPPDSAPFWRRALQQSMARSEHWAPSVLEQQPPERLLFSLQVLPRVFSRLSASLSTLSRQPFSRVSLQISSRTSWLPSSPISWPISSLLS